MFCFVEVPEAAEELLRKADLFAFVLLAVILAALIFGVFRLVKLNKEINSERGKRGNFKNYSRADGVIKNVEAESYSVTLYKDEQKFRKSRMESEHKYSDVLGNSTADKAKLIMSMYNRSSESESDNEHSIGDVLLDDEIRPKKTDVTRYRVTYEFNADGFDKPFVGEFLSYVKDESIKEGRSVTVLYNPERPNANFTERNAPVGY